MEDVEVNLPIRLGQFVKYASLAGSGAEAAELVRAGEIVVNGDVETRRGHKLSDDLRPATAHRAKCNPSGCTFAFHTWCNSTLRSKNSR